MTINLLLHNSASKLTLCACERVVLRALNGLLLYAQYGPKQGRQDIMSFSSDVIFQFAKRKLQGHKFPFGTSPRQKAHSSCLMQTLLYMLCPRPLEERRLQLSEFLDQRVPRYEPGKSSHRVKPRLTRCTIHRYTNPSVQIPRYQNRDSPL